jgi:hypothetical protein
MLLTRDAILASDDIKSALVDVPEWGVDAQVKIKALSIYEQIVYEKEAAVNKDTSDIIFNMLVLCCVNEDGTKIFSKDDIAALKERSSAAVLRVFNACLKINHLDTDSVERLAKN